MLRDLIKNWHKAATLRLREQRGLFGRQFPSLVEFGHDCELIGHL
ncbi:MAG: hypothetical protein ABIQ30_10145 [Devosia sp.]